MHTVKITDYLFTQHPTGSNQSGFLSSTKPKVRTKPGSTGGTKVRFREKTNLFKHFMNKRGSSS